MSLDEILSRINARREQLLQMGVAHLAVFGPPSQQGYIRKRELDLILRFTGPVTYDHYHRVKRLLEDALESRVDLVMVDPRQQGVDPFVDETAVQVI